MYIYIHVYIFEKYILKKFRSGTLFIKPELPQDPERTNNPKNFKNINHGHVSVPQ